MTFWNMIQLKIYTIKTKEEIIILVNILVILLEIVKRDGFETPRKALIELITNYLN